LLLKQGEEFRVREWRAVVGQPVEFFVLFRGVRGGVWGRGRIFFKRRRRAAF
jgi:hypothetical protein